MIYHLPSSAKIARPLTNFHKSIAHFRPMSNYSRLFCSNVLRHDQFRKNLAIVSRHVRQASTQNTPKTLTAKSEGKPKATESFPKIYLKFNPQSKELYLQLNDEVVGADSSIQNSQYCSICNTPQCKLVSGNKAAKATENKSSTITITVDRDAFCQAICNGSVDEPPPTAIAATQNANVGSDYCPLCDAPKCKLTEKVSDDASRTVNKVIEPSKEVEKALEPRMESRMEPRMEPRTEPRMEPRMEPRTEPSKEIKKGSEYCDICKADKCKLEEQLSGKPNQATNTTIDNEYINKPDVDESKSSNSTDDTEKQVERLTESNADAGKGSEYCKTCDAPVCKFRPKPSNNDPRSYSSQKSDGNRNANKRSRDSREVSKRSSGKSDETRNANSSEYCPLCKSTKCNFDSSETVVHTVDDVKSTSKNSDNIFITVNASEICAVVCEKEIPSRQTSVVTQNIDKSEKSAAMKNSTQQTTRFNSNYEKDNFRF